MPGPLCPSCGEKRLEAWGDEGGYLCPKGPKAKDGSGCRKLVSVRF
jgi:tRNA(Ile2) C34 agmatinyltransferase TiaS